MTKMQDFGRNLKDIRISKRLIQEDVEFLTGISVRSLSRLENGEIKQVPVDNLIRLSRIYEVDILNLYYKSLFETSYLYDDILNSLNISCMFMDKNEIYLISKKLELLEESNEVRKNEKNIRLLRLFVDRLKNQSLDKNEYRDRYEDITSSVIKNNLSFKDVDYIEARILAHICNDFCGYKNYDELEFLYMLTKESNSNTINFICKYYYANKLFDYERYDESKKEVMELLYEYNSQVEIERLSLLYYLMFLCEYKLSIKEYLNFGITSLELSKLSNRKKLTMLIDTKIQKLLKS